MLNKNRLSGSYINKNIDKMKKKKKNIDKMFTSHLQDNAQLSHLDGKGSQTSLRTLSCQILQFLLLGEEVSSCLPLSLELGTVCLTMSFLLTDKT